MEDEEGFLLGMGIVEEVQSEGRRAIIRSLLASLRGVSVLRLGGGEVDGQSFRDWSLEPPFRGEVREEAPDPLPLLRRENEGDGTG